MSRVWMLVVGGDRLGGEVGVAWCGHCVVGFRVAYVFSEGSWN